MFRSDTLHEERREVSPIPGPENDCSTYRCLRKCQQPSPFPRRIAARSHSVGCASANNLKGKSGYPIIPGCGAMRPGASWAPPRTLPGTMIASTNGRSLGDRRQGEKPLTHRSWVHWLLPPSCFFADPGQIAQRLRAPVAPLREPTYGVLPCRNPQPAGMPFTQSNFPLTTGLNVMGRFSIFY